MRTFKKILCAIDLQQHSELVADYAITLATAFDAEVFVAYVAPVFYDFAGQPEVDPTQLRSIEQQMFTGAEQRMRDFVNEKFRGVRAVTLVAQGDAAEGILDLAKAKEVDLIVMGTLGRSGLSRVLFGSVAEKVVKSAMVPVMTIRPPVKVE